MYMYTVYMYQVYMYVHVHVLQCNYQVFIL